MTVRVPATSTRISPIVGENVKVEHLDGSTSWAVPRAKHPAVFSSEILDEMAALLAVEPWPGTRVLDPFAGKGLVHRLPDLVRGVDEAYARRKMQTVGVELEPEWAACSPFGATLVGDSTALPAKWTRRFGAVVTSPCYGNRFADSHTNRDRCSECGGAGATHPVGWDGLRECRKCGGSGLSPRRSYTHDLGHALTDNNAGAMHYGDEYRALHRAVWGEVERVLKPGGLFLLNIKDHVRNKRRVRVSEWHRRTILKLGFEREATVLVPLRGMRMGQNHDARIPNELVYAFRKAA